jgi:hypothetical protein
VTRLFTVDLTKTLSVLKVGMLGCMAMDVDVSPTFQNALEVIGSWRLSLGFLSGMGPSVQVDSQKWSCEELVNEQLPAPSTHMTSL